MLAKIWSAAGERRPCFSKNLVYFWFVLLNNDIDPKHMTRIESFQDLLKRLNKTLCRSLSVHRSSFATVGLVKSY